MKKNRFKWGLIIFAVYFAYFIFGFTYNEYIKNVYIKKAEKKADLNGNSKLEIEEVLAVYRGFDYDGERLLHAFLSRKQVDRVILVAKPAQTESNKGDIAVDPAKPFNLWDLMRILIDSDKDGKLSFEEGAVVLIKLYETYPDQSYPLRLVALRSPSSLSDILFQIFFNPQNLTYGSELQRFATGQ